MPLKVPKIHVIQIKVDEHTYAKAKAKKGKKSWTEFLCKMVD